MPVHPMPVCPSPFLTLKSGLLQKFARVLLLALLCTTVWAQTPEIITVDGSAPAHAFPHFWEQMFGSGRAILTLRQNYRDDLRHPKVGRPLGVFLVNRGIYRTTTVSDTLWLKLPEVDMIVAV